MVAMTTNLCQVKAKLMICKMLKYDLFWMFI